MSDMVENKTTITATNNKQSGGDKARWYVAHTYSGYENKVKTDIEKTIENRKLQDLILDVRVPVSEEVEIKNGVKKTVARKLLPGYVFLYMYMNDVTWYVVRNTRGVTGFVGPGSVAVPLSEAEIRNMGLEDKEDEKAAPVVHIDVKVGDMINVVTGAWEGSSGTVKAINESKQTVTIDVDVFGRATAVEISFVDVQKI